MGFSELLPIFHVLGRRGEGASRDADHLRPDADAAAVERVDRDLVSLTHRAEHVGLGHLDTIENQLGRARCADPELVLFLAHREPWKASFDDEGRDALIASRGIHRCKNDVDLCLGPVRDPHLSAREDPPGHRHAARLVVCRPNASDPDDGSESA